MKRILKKLKRWFTRTLQKVSSQLYQVPSVAPKTVRRFIITWHKILIPMTVGMSIFLLIYGIGTIFPVDIVYIVGYNHFPVGLKKIAGQNLLFIKEHDIVNDLLIKNIDIEDVMVKKTYPSSLSIIIKSKQPIAQIKRNNVFYIVDKYGIVFYGDYGNRNLPVVIADTSEISIGSKFEEPYGSFVFSLADGLKKIGLGIKNIEIVNTQKIIYETNDLTILASTKSDLSEVSASLQTLIKRFRIEKRKPRVIDVRYNKPVMRF